MAKNYLDSTGVQYLWSKIGSSIDASAATQAQKAFEYYFGLANITTSITRDSSGMISKITQSNSSQSVSVIAIFTRNDDGSIKAITTTVTPTSGKTTYTETVTFTRDDNGISSITEEYSKATA